MKTWTGEKGFLWLRDGLHQQYPGARIFSCSISSTDDSVSETLLWDLIDDRSASNRMDIPMIIIAHSLGGSVAKALFVASSPSRSSQLEVKRVHSSIKGFMFFGTLQRSLISKKLQRRVRTENHVAEVVSEIPHLDQLFDKLPTINEEFKSLGGTQVPTVCFYEARKTAGVGIDVRLLCILKSFSYRSKSI